MNLSFEQIIGAVVLLLPVFVGIYLKIDKANGEKRLAWVQLAAETAFYATENAKRLAPESIGLGKVAYASGEFAKALRGFGQKPPDAREQELAELKWDAMHGAQAVALDMKPIGDVYFPSPQ
jgi:hypothetical protein